MNELPFLPAARAEFLDALGRYISERHSLAAEFIVEVERATHRIGTFPNHGSPYPGGTRRIVLRRFPFSIVYQGPPDDLLIVAVAHHSRRPGYWCDRTG